MRLDVSPATAKRARTTIARVVPTHVAHVADGDSNIFKSHTVRRATREVATNVRLDGRKSGARLLTLYNIQVRSCKASLATAKGLVIPSVPVATTFGVLPRCMLKHASGGAELSQLAKVGSELIRGAADLLVRSYFAKLLVRQRKGIVVLVRVPGAHGLVHTPFRLPQGTLIETIFANALPVSGMHNQLRSTTLLLVGPILQALRATEEGVKRSSQPRCITHWVRATFVVHNFGHVRQVPKATRGRR